MKKKFFKKVLAFTLAEVLITLSILGVVAAITVPSLINRNTEKQTVTKLKKEYSALAEAYEQLLVEYGPVSKWMQPGFSIKQRAEIIASRFKLYLNVVKECDSSSKGECFVNDNRKYLNNVPEGNMNAEPYLSVTSQILLKDGTAMLFGGSGSAYSITNDFNIVVDINGPKGPNTIGKDIFTFWITDKGIEPRTMPVGEKVEDLNTACNRNSNSGYGCAGWVVTKGNMDYLRKDVSWD